MTDPIADMLTRIRNAVTATGGGPSVRTASPEAGQHADEILREFGLGEDDIDDLRRRRVI